MKLSLIYRVVVFSPPSNCEDIISAIKKVDRLEYGNYSGVLWKSCVGEEQFVPSQEAEPTQGDVGCLSANQSIKIEFSIPEDKALLERIIVDAIVPHHPWETPVILVSTIQEVHL